MEKHYILTSDQISKIYLQGAKSNNENNLLELLKSFEKPKIEVILNEYYHNCTDGCCTDYGTELNYYNQDVGTIVENILNHLGFDVNIINQYNGE